MAALGRLIARHPSIAGGAAAFAVVFSFVSANAIWYQPGSHPSPLVSTRGDYEPRPIARAEEEQEPQTRIELVRADDEAELSVDDILAPIPARRVTSISILPDDASPPEDTTSTASIPDRQAAPSPEPAPQAAAERQRAPGAAPDSALIREMQQELARLGHYDGAIDGIAGPMTSRALRAYAERTDLQGTPEPSARLVERMRLAQASSETASAAPAERSAAAVPETPRAAEPAQYVPPMDIPNAVTEDGTALVAQIQQGLSNIAYADIAVDGVAGSETRQAIRRFESDYRLPETGRPNGAVLEKLKEIGAL